MNILAFDPGRTTGVCIARATENNFAVMQVSEIPWSGRFALIKAFIHGISPTTNSALPSPDVIVIESFRLRQNRALQLSGSNFPSSQVTGIIQAFAWQLDLLDHIVFQEPPVMNRVQILPDDLDIVKGSEHKKDAYKHARYYYVTKVWQGGMK